jgi:hypothetical protein
VIADAPATVVWIAAGTPGADDQRRLAGWARAHGVTLAVPIEAHPPALRVALDVADAVEDLLDRARDAIAARDAAVVEGATAAAEGLLRANPALPQAAWLMAEVERARATRWRRVAPVDAEAGDRAWTRAEALDGGRVAGIGEVESAAPAPAATVALAYPADEEATLDGRLVSGPLTTAAGLHDLVVTVEGAPVWAAWIEIAPGSSSLAIDAPGVVPCSAADVARATRASSSGASPVSCGSWIAVAPGARPGSLRVARCEAGRCEPFAEWTEAPAWSRAPIAAKDERAAPKAWPVWATWALAGAGVALAAGIAVVASGALESAPTSTRFVTGGLKAQ